MVKNASAKKKKNFSTLKVTELSIVQNIIFNKTEPKVNIEHKKY